MLLVHVDLSYLLVIGLFLRSLQMCILLPQSSVLFFEDSNLLPVLNDFFDDSFLRLGFVVLNVELLKEFFGHCEIGEVNEGGFCSCVIQ